ncbi:hypothetical protein ACIRU2_13355 [Streptomyces sp. NPDC101169]|uniref:hypothetical protein n=1 Tax=Streptomyces sp. NPDC101169 TaxID=3366121 RepID=UPI0038123DB8
MDTTAQAGPFGLAAATALLGLLAVACGGGGTASQPVPGRGDAEPGHSSAYDAGWRTGKQLFEDGGKGAAVREVVWGGCVRRSLTARPRDVVEKDRGAWVLGCEQGVKPGADRRPPARQVTRRESDPGLLARFRTWAAAHGGKRSARHVDRVVLVRLGDRDYDVELTTTYTGGSGRADAERLAGTFATWWDGDDGDTATAWNLILLGPDGERLTTRSL